MQWMHKTVPVAAIFLYTSEKHSRVCSQLLMNTNVLEVSNSERKVHRLTRSLLFKVVLEGFQ